jgi:hypothetical protein
MKRHSTTVMSVISIPARPLESVALKTMYHALVIETVKQIIQLFRERYTKTCIVDLSMCIKHIINQVQHRIRIIQKLKIKGSTKPVRRTQGM